VCSERTGHAGTRPAAVGVSCCSLPGLASGLLVTELSRRPCARTCPPCVYWSLRTVTRRVGGRSVGRVSKETPPLLTDSTCAWLLGPSHLLAVKTSQQSRDDYQRFYRASRQKQIPTARA